jgi:hypothetical protein
MGLSMVVAGPGSMAVESWDLGSMVVAGPGSMAVESWDLGCMAADPWRQEAGLVASGIPAGDRCVLRLAAAED